MKKCAFRTLGCKVNQYETQSIRESFIEAGYREVGFGETSDVYVINTCTVTAKTDKESRRLVREAHRRTPRALIVVTGCYVERNEDDVRRIPVDHVIAKNSDKDRIVDIVNSGGDRSKSPLGNDKYLPLAISDFKDRTKAFLKVQDGCDNFCSYCKVPLARGRSRSRDRGSILLEARRLISRGFKEIVLTGICLGAWGEDLFPKSCLSELLDELMGLERGFRLRLSSIEPRYVSKQLVSTIKSSPKICKHLHIPFQSGDDKILKKMNRPYTAAKYLNIAEMVRSYMPEVSITTDILVGFPGETEANFVNTCRFIEEIRPLRVHVFSYSKRDGTAAALFKEEMPKYMIKRRLSKVMDLALDSSYKYRKNFLHRKTEVLIEGERDEDTGLLRGYDDKYIKILLKGEDVHMSSVVPVRIDEVGRERTYGAISQN